MYVNDLTADMGEAGRQSLERLYTEAAECGMAPEVGAIDLAG
jgi:predicted solute-binding protein